MKFAALVQVVIILATGSLCFGKNISLLSLYSYYNNKSYEFSLTKADTEKLPKWNINKDPLPLSPQQALNSARKQLKKIVEQPEQWTLNEIKLMPIDDNNYWVYVVRFLRFHSSSNSDSPVDSISILVLLNGKTINPKITR